MKVRKLLTFISFLATILAVSAFLPAAIQGQSRAYVEARAEGWYWINSPKPWFTRLVAISNSNKKLPKNDHDESLPTIPGYYHRKIEISPFTRYPFVSVSVRHGKATFITKRVRNVHFVFRGNWGTAYLKSAMIEDVPFLRGTLWTYRRGKLIKRERVRFGHAVNA